MVAGQLNDLEMNNFLVEVSAQGVRELAREVCCPKIIPNLDLCIDVYISSMKRESSLENKSSFSHPFIHSRPV